MIMFAAQYAPNARAQSSEVCASLMINVWLKQSRLIVCLYAPTGLWSGESDEGSEDLQNL